MLIRHKSPLDIQPSEITSKSVYRDRRRFLATAAFAGIGATFAPLIGPASIALAAAGTKGRKLEGVIPGPFATDEDKTPYEDITAYNNFYEFGTGKTDPARKAHTLMPMPWKVKVDGAAGKPGVYDYDDLIRPHKLEERIYRMRCVEAWSMVVPWVGIPLADIIKRLEPAANAKFVAFETLVDPKQMPGQRFGALNWPYVEGLRMDEAMNPLTILAVGLYGEEMPNQNGAPIRLVVPWKYGFKSIKSIVRIQFVEEMPPTTWNMAAPREYGFYSNVNPTVNHPRWSQAKERRIGDFLKRKTLPFNGYAEQVADLYAGMDLSKFY